MVPLQGPELQEQKLLILMKEIEIHCINEKGKVWSKLFFTMLFLLLILNAFGIGSDTRILIRYT